MSAVDSKKRILVAGAVSYRDGDSEATHVHDDHAQLKWPRTGLATVRTDAGVFVIPPAYALWIPAGARHGGSYTGDVLEQNLYLHASQCARLPPRCCAVAVSLRLRSVSDRVLARDVEYAEGDPVADDRAACAILEEELIDAGIQPLQLQLPNARVRLVFDLLSQRPADDRDVAAWARRLGTSARSLNRSFQTDTGLPFGAWRTRARLLFALQRLALGADVASIAREVGYASDSAFIHVFRRTLGTTPGRYYPHAWPAPRSSETAAAAAQSHPTRVVPATTSSTKTSTGP